MFGLTGARAALVDIAGMIERGIVVCYTDGGPSVNSTAELALALMLAAARRIPQGRRLGACGHVPARGASRLHALRQDRGFDRPRPHRRADGALLQRARNASYRLEPDLTDERASAGGASRVSKEELLATADVVGLHLVISDRTRGLLGASDLARMKPGAILVNTSRGPLVDEAALIDAVQSGRLFAALDVYHREPLRADYPLLRCPNTVLTPHLGYSVLEVYADYYRQSVENALAFLDGNPLRVLERPQH